MAVAQNCRCHASRALVLCSLFAAVVAPAAVRTYSQGTMLYLESTDGEHTVRIGVSTYWGGTITETSYDGVNYVNTNDPGRMIQTSLWDGNVDYNRSWSYNPYQAGDESSHPSPVIAQSLTANMIYTKTWPLEWSPWSAAGLPGPVASDAYIEQWISPVPGHPNGFKVHLKVTHFGTDAHAVCGQEFPVVYVNRGIDTFVYYGGTVPWTGGGLTHYTMPYNPQRSPQLYTPENWGAYVDANDSGLAVYMPGSYPWMYGFNAAGPSPGGTNHFVGTTPACWAPGTVLESDFYVFAGPVQDARAAIYDLQPSQSAVGPFPPLGYLDQPADGSTVSGVLTMSGWTTGLSTIVDIGLFVDGVRAGAATYGSARPDVADVFPHISATTGFAGMVDTTRWTNGSHIITAKVTDSSGLTSTLAKHGIVIANPDHVPVFANMPVDCSVVVGGDTTFAVVVTGTPPPVLCWQALAPGQSLWADLSEGGEFTGTTSDTVTVHHVALLRQGMLFRCVATNTTGTVTSSGATLTVLSRIVGWRLQHFGATADTGAAANTADPDGDGRCNLIEYAVGGNPTVADFGDAAVLGTAADSAGNHLTLTFSRIADPVLSYTVEASNDLVNWASIWNSTGAQNSDGPVTVTDPTTVQANARRFLRLRVSY